MMNTGTQTQPKLYTIPGDPAKAAEFLRQFGEPWSYSRSGIPEALNQIHYAAAYAARKRVRYSPGQHAYAQYSEATGKWELADEAFLSLELAQMVRDDLRKASTHSEHDREADRTANADPDCLAGKITGTFLSAVLKLVKGFGWQKLSCPGIVLHLSNGMLHLDDAKAECRPFNPAYLSESGSRVAYKEGATCPRFLKELLEPALSPEDISLVQRYAGQCLLGFNLCQGIMLVRGTAGGGKSQLVNVLEGIVGLHNVTELRTEHLGGRFEVSALAGKTLVTGKDVSSDFFNRPAASKLKALVGGDGVQGERKYKNRRVDVRGTLNVIVTSNSRLNLRLDQDREAWRRRLLVVDFCNKPPAVPVAEFATELLQSEGPGILNWCIAGMQALLAELKTRGRIQMTDAQARRVDDLLEESEGPRYFVENCVERRPGANVTSHELYVAYLDMCERIGWRKVLQTAFQKLLVDLMPEIHRSERRTDIARQGTNRRGYANVAVRTASAEAEPAAGKAAA
ncbi:MAG: hypothetical protein BWZ02_00129 [Lentisphaerae bacterium ADurb.BinA184]|nr:MAG: hypothetical protein BWZ02_00129 [Lentisphaerae bacterium ADurb.BinA184]